MNIKNKVTTVFLFLVLVLSTFLLTGCGKDPVDGYGYKRIEDSSEHAEAGENISDLTLAAGQILAVRLVYDPEKESSDTDWYKVQLSRVGKTWKDSVKIEGIIRSRASHYDDYRFSSKNFNWQIEKEQYDIDTLSGEYELSIQGSNGYNRTYTLHRDEGGWTNTYPTLTFYAP